MHETPDRIEQARGHSVLQATRSERHDALIAESRIHVDRWRPILQRDHQIQSRERTVTRQRERHGWNLVDIVESSSFNLAARQRLDSIREELRVAPPARMARFVAL